MKRTAIFFLSLMRQDAFQQADRIVEDPGMGMGLNPTGSQVAARRINHFSVGSNRALRPSHVGDVPLGECHMGR